MATDDRGITPVARATDATPRISQIARRPLLDRMVLAVLAGVVAGVGVLAADVALHGVIDLRLGNVQSFRTLLTSFVSGLITVAVFSLWMRTVVVGLVSDQFSPRTLTRFLDDSFQHRLLAIMTSGLVFEVVLLMGLTTQTDAAVPPIALVTSVLVAVTALAGVLMAVRRATRALSMPEVVGTLTDTVLDVLSSQPRGGQAVDAATPGPHAFEVPAVGIGWIGRIDVDGIMAAIPPGTVVHLNTRTGDFVTPRRCVATVTPPPDGADVDVDAVADRVQVARTRSMDLDLALALGQLVDVAVHALAGGGKDTATAHESLVHLGAVLEEIIEAGLPPSHRRDDEGRVVFDGEGWGPADHVQLVCERLRDAASAEPLTARHLMRMLEHVRETAERVGDRETVGEIDGQIQAILRLAESQGMIRNDIERLRRIAKRASDEAVEAPGASEA